jgi:hypothetical protein
MTGMIALFNKPPNSSKPMYHVAEVIVLIAGVLQVLGTLWVSCDARNRLATERRILYASSIMFMLGLILGAYTLMSSMNQSTSASCFVVVYTGFSGIHLYLPF